MTEQRIDRTGGRAVTIRSGPNVWVALYAEERKHLVEVCSAALKAGVEERQVRLAEHQGALIEGAIRAILTDLHPTSAQLELVPTVVPRRLREIARGERGS